MQYFQALLVPEAHTPQHMHAVHIQLHAHPPRRLALRATVAANEASRVVGLGIATTHYADIAARAVVWNCWLAMRAMAGVSGI